MDGFIIVDKEKNMTSHDACMKLKRILKNPHIGHTGTLDPNTTGVLVCAIGKATKLMPLLIEHEKEYYTTILFGKSSDTLDITGNILEDRVVDINIEDVRKALTSLKNEKWQLPPMFSSIKINGKKLYEYARKNQTVEVAKRPIEIFDLDVKSDVYEIDGYKCIDLYMRVSKGFYVRSLARDLGDILNVPSLMFELRRESSGDFNIKDSKILSLIDENAIIPIEKVFSNLEILNVNDFLMKLVYNGVVLDERQIITNKPFRVYNNGKMIAIYQPYEENKYKPVVLFKE